MHVCMVLDKTFPSDIRVSKEARALAAGGHDVTLLCEGSDGTPTETTVGPLTVVRLDVDTPPTRRRVESLRYYLSFVHPRWRRRLDELVRGRGIDAIHVHDLPMVATGLAVGDDRDIPVVADLHENYPEAIRQWRRMDDEFSIALPSLAERSLYSVRRLKRLEGRCVRRADRVLAVCEEAERHYHRDCRALPNRTEVVGNTVDLTAFDADADPIDGFDDEFVVSYIGKYAPHRGLDTVVEALPDLLRQVPDARLLVVGAPGTSQYGEEIDTLVAELGIEDRVTFTGWVDFEEVPRYTAASDVCLVPHADTPHTRTTIPHKLFQYMAVEKPVVVTDVPPLERVVSESEAGIVVPSGDTGAMATSLTDLYDDPDRAERLGANGRRAVVDRYNWERDATRLRKMYESLATEQRA